MKKVGRRSAINESRSFQEEQEEQTRHDHGRQAQTEDPNWQERQQTTLNLVRAVPEISNELENAQ
jgi:hypothetical protein